MTKVNRRVISESKPTPKAGATPLQVMIQRSD
jgi:hypothetical protein